MYFIFLKKAVCLHIIIHFIIAYKWQCLGDLSDFRSSAPVVKTWMEEPLVIQRLVAKLGNYKSLQKNIEIHFYYFAKNSA